MKFLENYATASWGLATGLAWLWAFLGLLVVACVLVSGGIGVLVFIDVQLEMWHERRGHVRMVGSDGRERWVSIQPEARAALERTVAEIRDLPEVRRG